MRSIRRAERLFLKNTLCDPFTFPSVFSAPLSKLRIVETLARTR
jgi:hypothetical protein